MSTMESLKCTNTPSRCSASPSRGSNPSYDINKSCELDNYIYTKDADSTYSNLIPEKCWDKDYLDRKRNKIKQQCQSVLSSYTTSYSIY